MTTLQFAVVFCASSIPAYFFIIGAATKSKFVESVVMSEKTWWTLPISLLVPNLLLLSWLVVFVSSHLCWR